MCPDACYPPPQTGTQHSCAGASRPPTGIDGGGQVLGEEGPEAPGLLLSVWSVVPRWALSCLAFGGGHGMKTCCEK